MEKFNFKKKFGQNFLRDDRIVEKIVQCSEIPSDTLVIEVGPGAGVLTRCLARVSKNVLCYEIDSELEDTLMVNLKDFNNVDIIFDDFLNRNILEDIKKYQFKHLYFVSNVPYYITTPILLKLIDEDFNIEKVVMMVQKEVGERFSSIPGRRDYSSISVFLNYYFDICKLFEVDRREFVPVPNVDSVVVSFKRKENGYVVDDKEKFFKLVKDSFKYKRKTIKNNLKGYPLDKVEAVLKKYKFDLSVRAEDLSVQVFVDLSNNI